MSCGAVFLHTIFYIAQYFFIVRNNVIMVSESIYVKHIHAHI